MGKYYVDEVKYGLEGGGMACGPIGENVISSVKVTDCSKSFWLTNVEVTGIPSFYLSEDEIFDRLVDACEDDDFLEYLDQCFINSFEGIKLGEYGDIYKSIKQNEGNPAVSLIRYIILLTRCSMEEEDGIIALAKGKFVDELEILLFLFVE